MEPTDDISSNPSSQKLSAPKVLIAEKDQLLRLMMAKLLQVSGYRVRTCGDGPQALGLIAKRSFDLVITDLMLVGAEGMEVLKSVVTDTPSSETLLEAKYAGAYAYLRKPLQLRQFLLILKDAVEHSRLQEGYQLQRELERGSLKAEQGV
jgi:DNA-binding NtrC family response regulator